MQRISRIYLGNCGYSGAWYDGITLDLNDPDTDLPADSIFHLVNGGGKTSLLGLIFSCFETGQDRFLKHIQNKNDHFSQYFSQDGLPGVILVEWLMPARSASSGPYRLVLGQTVSIRAGAEQHSPDRIFFSFDSREGLEFTDVPAPRLGAAPATTMAEFSRWLYGEQKKHAGNVYITRKQVDWHAHLRDGCLIDVEMLQMQVNFSAEEGGFDKGFLQFTNESEFLRKFFHLTLDPEQTRTVREGVVVACDKLRRKPQFVLRLTELSKLLGVLQTFDAAAQVHQQAKADQSGVLVEGAILAVALQNRAVSRKTQQEKETVFEKDQRALGASAFADTAAHLKDELTLTSLLHNKRVQRSKVNKESAQSRFKGVETKIGHVKAARLNHELDTLATRLAEMETSEKLALEGLKPFLSKVEVQGALLRWELNNERVALLEQLAGLKTNAETRETSLEKNKLALAQLVVQDRKAVLEQANLTAANAAALGKKVRLLKEGLYLDADEATPAGVQRWSEAALASRAEKAGLESEKTKLEGQCTASEHRAKAEGVRVATLSGQMNTLHAFIAEGEAEREKLSESPALTQAAQTDSVDPDSPALLPLLESEAAAAAKEVSFSDVRLAELNASRQSIDETGVAGRNADVELVVARLRKAGVRSARPFNGYLAEALSNVDKARALVLSDPARFLGVAVALEEMPQVRALAWPDARPSKPVLVSPYALEPESRAEGHTALVVPADSDAAFNLAAAKAMALSLDERITKEQGTKNAYGLRHTAAITAMERLKTYLVKFGEGKLGRAQVEVLAQKSTRDGAVAAEAEAAIQAGEFAVAAKAKATDIGAKEKLAGEQERNAGALRQFWDEHEADAAGRQEQLEELTAVLENIGAQKLELEEASLALLATGQTEFVSKIRLEALAAAHFTELGTVKYYDKAYNAKLHLEATPADLVTLRKTYEDARSVFDTEESNRLGVLKAKLEAVRSARVDKVAEYTRDFSGVMKSDLLPYRGLDHTALLPGLAVDLEAAHQNQVNAEAAFNTASKESTEWHRVNKTLQFATPHMLTLDQAALLAEQAQAQQLKDKAAQSSRLAYEAADKAKLRAAELAAQALADEQRVASLITGLDLPQDPDPELIRLQYASLVAEKTTGETDMPLVLALDAHAQVNALIGAFKEKEKGIAAAGKLAHNAFDALKTAAADKALGGIEPELSTQMLTNNFDAACSDSARLLEGLEDRIGTTQSNLERMTADFEACVEELLAVTHQGIRVLNSATAAKNRVPAGAQYVGGKQILKMSARFTDLSSDARRQSVRYYLDSLIDTNVVPAKGSDLVADSVLRQNGGKPLGLRVLKMVPDEAKQYVELDKISNSGGEGVVMAMFLYLLITQLRGETQAKLRKTGGGPLILDNPFAKATSSAMWKAQRLLAEAIGVQLIFATASQDYNAVGDFPRFIVLRQASKNSKTERLHLEAVDVQMSRPLAEAA